MIPNNQWKLDIMDALSTMARPTLIRVWAITSDEVQALRASVQAPLREDLMNRDTVERTGGACPTGRDYLQRQYKLLAEACAKCWNPQKETS